MNRCYIPESYICGANLNLNKSSKKSWLIVSILVMNIIVIYLLVMIFFYFLYADEIIKTYTSLEYSHYLTLISIVVVIRILISIYLTSFFFKRWISQNIKHYTDIPFLLGIFFYFLIITKLLDLVIFTMYAGYEIFSNPEVFNLLKFRLFLGILNILPIMSLGAYFFFLNRNLDKPSFERDEVIKRNTLIFSVVWVGGHLLFIIFIPSAELFLINYIITCIVFLLISWVFLTAYKGKILPEINCLIISIGFAFYLISHVLPAILIFTILKITLYSFLLGTLIGEILALISFIVILIGFKTKANYSV